VRGNYRPKKSLPIAISKADLLARNMHIPHPDDALVLQVISETLLPPIQRKSPSSNAIFARSHHEHTGIHKQEQMRIYSWFHLWPKYQEQILRFAKTRKFLVVTDILNFFDSVGFTHIRRRIETEVPKSQAVIDLMLLEFENFIRRDMYAPVILQGIPTIDVDAPRLVGHALLFPVDKYLKKTTRNCFARWMDDINFGADTISEARERIREIDRILRDIGLRLGGGKTKILSYSAAREYLQADENQRLNVIGTAVKKRNGKFTVAEASALCRGLLRFRDKSKVGHWDKVMRRYYRLIADANLSGVKRSKSYIALLRKVETVSRIDYDTVTTSEYRTAIIRLWATLPVTSSRLNRLLDALAEVHSYDDAVAFSIGEALTRMRLEKRHATVAVRRMLQILRTSTAPGFYFAAAWVLAKYGTERDIVEFVSRSKGLWDGNYFFARQAVVLWSLLDEKNNAAKRIRDMFTDAHDPDIESTVKFIEQLRRLTKLDGSFRGVLPINANLRSIDLPRAIVSCSVMRSRSLESSVRKSNKERIDALTSDPRLRAISKGRPFQ
jgi:hypothetical protein